MRFNIACVIGPDVTPWMVYKMFMGLGRNKNETHNTIINNGIDRNGRSTDTLEILIANKLLTPDTEIKFDKSK